MKVLHITYWYPNEIRPQEGNFVCNHIEGLEAHCENEVFHIGMHPSDKFLKVIRTDKSRIFQTKFFKYFRVQEWLAFWTLFNLLLIKRRGKKFDLINFHVATPLCRYISFFQFFMRKPVVITEHWTAYYRYFNLPKNHSGLKRIKRIFFKNIHLITVSEALGEDIKTFSANKKLEYSVVPNSVDTKVFKLERDEQSSLSFFMMTNWNPEKNPIRVFEAIAQIDGLDCTIYVAGDGPRLEEMKAAVDRLGLTKRVEFVGRISPAEAAKYFNQVDAFLHASNYETFSVVCAEALCCGCPVVASDIPAIAEYLDVESGILVPDFEKTENEKALIEAWKNSISQLIDGKSGFDRVGISAKFQSKFGHQNVGELYYSVLKNISSEG